MSQPEGTAAAASGDPAASQEGCFDAATSEAEPADRQRKSDRVPGIFIWLVWLVMTLAALVYVSRYGSNVPSWDEWDMVPTLTGVQPVTWDWLWSQHNEHRVPLPRLILLALNRPLAIDFRTAMYVNVLLASALAAGAILTASRVRGRAQWTDAAIPLLLLNLGQGLNFVWGWQVEFFTSTALAGAVLLLIVLRGERPTAGLAILVGALLALLVGTGAHGVALVPALASWLALAGVLRWREGTAGARRAAVALLIVSLLGFLLTAMYFVGYERVPYHPSSSGKRASVVTAIQFLTMSFGPAVRQTLGAQGPSVWPYSGLLVVALLAGAGLLSLLAAWRHAGERVRALGLACFMGAMACLAVGIGLGRDGFEPRYITLSVPVMLAAYFAISLYAPSGLGASARWAMLIAAAVALWPNTRSGLEYGRQLRANLAAFERDIAAGVPPYRLIHDHGGWLHPHPDVVGDYLPLLQKAGVEPYVRLAENPRFREVRLELVPVETHELAWSQATATAQATGYRPHLVFLLDRPLRVAGIRLRYTHHKSSEGVPYVSIFWHNGGADEFDADRFSKYSATGDHANWHKGTFIRRNDSTSMMTVWPMDTVGAIRVHPDFEPCTFTIHELTLLVEE